MPGDYDRPLESVMTELLSIILAAGEGTRMKSSTPKMLHTLAGRSLLGHVLVAARSLDPALLAVVVRHERDRVAEHAVSVDPDAVVVDQGEIPGTGRAVQCALAALDAKAHAQALLHGVPDGEEDTNELKGFAACSGVVEGTARVVKSVEEIGRIQQGDILVCQVTNPTWSPIFQRISAAVSDIGGSMSHMAIVAREYDLPAVVGTGKATQRIRDGQRIRVDGGRGVVTILDEERVLEEA